MERYSTKTLQQLRTFIQSWLKEKGTNERLIIGPTEIIIQEGQSENCITIPDLLTMSPLLSKCLQDLRRPGIEIIPIPDYLEYEDEQRLTLLLNLTQQPMFRKRKTPYRLEIFYYLGEVLSTRGFQQNDIKQLRDMFSTSKGATDFKKTARRTYELFQARGLANLYTVTFIRPSHLIDLSEEEFYNYLLPEARNLHIAENFSLY